MADNPITVWRSPDCKTFGVVINWGVGRTPDTMTEAALRSTVEKLDETSSPAIARMYSQALVLLCEQKERAS